MELYQSLFIVVLALVAVIAGFSMLVLYKIFRSAKERLEILKFVGEIAIALGRIGQGKHGFVRFHGEHWKVISKTAITPSQKVKIIAKRKA